MPPKTLVILLLAVSARAQTPEAQAAALRALAAGSPQLPLHRAAFKVAGLELGFPSSVTMDKSGNLYILQRGEKADPVLVADRNGHVLRSWGKGMYKIPHSIRIDPAGNVWTVDAASSMVFEFTPQGRKLMEIAVGGQPKIASEFNGTTDIAFAPNGHLFIADGYGNARILEYTREGKRIREWGTAGTGPGQFHLPHGIAIDENGVIYVADRENGRVQKFDLTGKFMGEWRNLGKVFGVTIGTGAVWVSTQQRNEPNGSAGWFMKIDRRTGKVLGCMESLHGQHTVNVSGNGDLTAGARPDSVLWFR